MALVIKNPPANVGDIRDMGLISRSGRSFGEGWIILWTEEPGGI